MVVMEVADRVDVRRLCVNPPTGRGSYVLMVGAVAIIPWIGNLIDAAINYNLVVQTSYQIEIPQTVLRQMYINNIVSLVLSLIPFLGTYVLHSPRSQNSLNPLPAGIGLMAHWKANYRNAHILEDYLRSKSGGGSRQHVVQGAASV